MTYPGITLVHLRTTPYSYTGKRNGKGRAQAAVYVRVIRLRSSHPTGGNDCLNALCNEFQKVTSILQFTAHHREKQEAKYGVQKEENQIQEISGAD